MADTSNGEKTNSNSWPRLKLSELLPPGPGFEVNHAAQKRNKPISKNSLNAEQDLLLAFPGAVAYSGGPEIRFPADAFRTLSEAMLFNSIQNDARGLIYVHGEGFEVFQSYYKLLKDSMRLLGGLQKAGLGAGDNLLIQVRSAQEYFTALWACILGGIHPLLMDTPPVYNSLNIQTHRIHEIWRLRKAPAVLLNRNEAGIFHKAFDELDELNPLPASESKQTLKHDEVTTLSYEDLKKSSSPGKFHRSFPEDTAFYQVSYKKESPQILRETHKGIIARIHSLLVHEPRDKKDISLNWTSPTHPISLFFHLNDLYCSCRQIHASNSLIIFNPLKWLHLIEEYKVTHSWGPGYGYRMLANRLPLETEMSWNLSSMRSFIQTDTPLSYETLRDFLARTRPYGIKENNIKPAYFAPGTGICLTYQNNYTPSSAHHIVKSSIDRALVKAKPEPERKSSVSFINSGAPLPGVRIRVLSPDGRVLPEGYVGAFQVGGELIAPILEADKTEGHWLDTRQYGFMSRGRPCLTGRARDVVGVHGTSYFSYELEDIINSLDGIVPSHTAACTYKDRYTETSKLAIFFGTLSSNPEENISIIKQIHSNLMGLLDISPDFVIPLTPEEFPRAESSRIRKAILIRKLSQGRYDETLKLVGQERAWKFARE